MRTLLLVLTGMLFVLDVQAQASFVTGDKLLENCREVETRSEAFNTGVCAGYVTAVADAMALPVVGGLRACIPIGVTTRQIVAVVTKYLRDHPEELHYSANSTATLALRMAFPCSK